MHFRSGKPVSTFPTTDCARDPRDARLSLSLSISHIPYIILSRSFRADRSIMSFVTSRKFYLLRSPLPSFSLLSSSSSFPFFRHRQLPAILVTHELSLTLCVHYQNDTRRDSCCEITTRATRFAFLRFRSASRVDEERSCEG